MFELFSRIFKLIISWPNKILFNTTNLNQSSATHTQAFTHSVLRGIENEVGALVFDKDSWDPCIQVIANGIQGN